jgi:hypothetical protein
MSRVCQVAAVLVFVTGSAMSAWAQGKEPPFRDGLEARDARKWADVARHMRRAIEIDPKESKERVKRGIGRFAPGTGTEYLPHYFLGEALFNQGNCAGAMEAWFRSEQLGVIQSLPEWFNPMQVNTASCEQKGLLRSPKFEEVVVRAAQAIAQVSSAADAVTTRSRSAGEVFTAERKAQLEEVGAGLQDARRRLETARRSRLASEFVEAEAVAHKAGAALTELMSALEASVAIRDRINEGLSALDRELNVAGSIDRVVEGKKALLTDALSTQRQQARDVLARARKVADARAPVANLASIGDARGDVATAKGQLDRIVDELVRIEQKQNEARFAQQLRDVRQRFSRVTETLKVFDRRAAARGDTDPKLVTERQQLEKAVVDARRKLDAAAKSGNADGITAAGVAADDVGSRLDRLILTFGEVTIVDRGVPEPLARAAAAFFAGDFAAAEGLLEPEGGFAPDTPFLEHILVFRAASRFAQHVASGAAASPFLTQAVGDVHELTRLNPAFVPDGRAFSPRFLQFFRAAREGASAVDARPTEQP